MYYLLTFIIPTIPPTTQAENKSKNKFKSKIKLFAKIEKQENADKIYKKPKATPLINPLDFPFMAIHDPTKTLIAFISKFNG